MLFKLVLGFATKTSLKYSPKEIAKGALSRERWPKEPPSAPVKGMVRHAASPWDPLGNGFTGLVVYSGNAWVQV